jgi:serine/threonine-protein kinase RsbW
MSLRPFREDLALGEELLKAIDQTDISYTLVGLRRQVTSLAHASDGALPPDLIHLERMGDDDAKRLVEIFAYRYGIETNGPTRDLIVQQLNGSAFFIREFIAAAAESKTQLIGFLDCQKLYVDELLGGRLKRHFDRILEMVAPNSQTRRTLMRVLYESAAGESRKASLWAWKKRLGVPAPDFERLIDALHVSELVNSTGAVIEVNSESYAWMDYLRAHYQVDVATEPRAKIVAATLIETLKRAPQTMARKYRRESVLGLRDLLAEFNCQSVPASLFHYDRFAAAYKGSDIVAIDAGLDAESELIRLPQIVYVAPASAYSTEIKCEPESCVVGHGFEAAEYTDDNEVVWLAAEFDSKLEASREITASWCDRLEALAGDCGLPRARVWLITPEGFSESAGELLNEREAFGSSRKQAELLAARIKSERPAAKSGGNEYEMIIPMGEDTELIAANTAEQIARRANFRPEAINQIKTALVEACINAAEHSLSPDRKIYQRFVVEDDKLVVTVSSRGVVPAQLGQNGQDNDTGAVENGKSRRGWGLKLIKTLMDEVVFERVDDGTQLRMTKYIR